MTATVLICDNEEPLLALVRASLSGRGYVFAEARDGHESLELARSLRPDLILLDIIMPGLNGLTVLSALRADRELARTPVIMLSASTGRAERDAAAEAGVDRFITKPFSPAELVAVVEDLLERGK